MAASVEGRPVRVHTLAFALLFQAAALEARFFRVETGLIRWGGKWRMALLHLFRAANTNKQRPGSLRLRGVSFLSYPLVIDKA
jgi:hypothetical protein